MMSVDGSWFRRLCGGLCLVKAEQKIDRMGGADRFDWPARATKELIIAT